MYQVINMDMDFSKKLQGFDKVWRRVQQAKQCAPKQPPRQNNRPPQKKPNSRARRFDPR